MFKINPRNKSEKNYKYSETYLSQTSLGPTFVFGVLLIQMKLTKISYAETR